MKKYLDSSYTQGFLVLHEDSISFESYYLGQNKNTRHISWSVAKSFVSALIGIAINVGYIESIEDNLFYSSRNINNVTVIPVSSVSTFDLLDNITIIADQKSIEYLNLQLSK